MCGECERFLEAMFTLGEEPYEVTDFMEEYRTEPDVELSDIEPDGLVWVVAVAKMGGTSDLDKPYRPGERWIVNQYENGSLVDSIVVKHEDPKSTRQVAIDIAENTYGYMG